MQGIKFKANPYTWTLSGGDLKTNVVSFEVRSSNESLLSFENMPQPVDVFLPVDGQAHDDAQLNHVHVQSNDSTTFSIATSNGNVAVKMTLYLNDTWTGNSRSTFIA